MRDSIPFTVRARRVSKVGSATVVRGHLIAEGTAKGERELALIRERFADTDAHVLADGEQLPEDTPVASAELVEANEETPRRRRKRSRSAATDADTDTTDTNSASQE